MAKKRRKFLKQVNKGGKTYFYHRRNGFPCYAVSSDVDVDDPCAVENDFQCKSKHITWSPSRDTDVRHILRNGISRAKERAVKYKRECTITLADVLDLYDKQSARCAISGMRFSAEKSKHGHANPFRPSIDRIDNTQGYTPDNVQIVLAGVNVAKSNFCEEEYLRICQAVARNNRGSKVDMSPGQKSQVPDKGLKNND